MLKFQLEITNVEDNQEFFKDLFIIFQRYCRNFNSKVKHIPEEWKTKYSRMTYDEFLCFSMDVQRQVIIPAHAQELYKND